MKHSIFLCGALAIMHLSCSKKGDPTPDSYWAINNDTIAFRDIITNTAPSLSGLRVISLPFSHNELSIAFWGRGSLPHSGVYKIDYVASDLHMCNVYVTYNGIDYDVSSAHNTTSVRVTTLPNGKGKFELEPTWFYNQPDQHDSIFVKGVIIEP